MILRFFSGSVTPARRSRNSCEASTNTSGSCRRSNRLRICVGFVEPQHAVVHEDARQLVADRAMDDQRGDRRIHAAAQRADDASVADLRANPRRRLLDKRRHRPVAGAAADAEGEVAQDLEAALGVDDFGMEQQRVEAALRVRHRRDRRVGAGRDHRRSLPARRRRNRRGSPTRESRRARREQRARTRSTPNASRARTRAAAPARPARRARRAINCMP